MTAHKNVYIALAAAQAAMGPVTKGATNPHFKSKYADLADVMQVAIPALTANGIATWHSIVSADGKSHMRTTLSHGESDTHMNCDVELIVAKHDMQGIKSATTYAKRIGIESLTGIAPEDDDGNAAAKAAPKDEPKPDTEAVQKAAEYLSEADSLEDLKARWGRVPKPVTANPDVIAAKDAAKERLSQTPPADAMNGDMIPY